jgi:hypothetical protein
MILPRMSDPVLEAKVSQVQLNGGGEERLLG